MMNRPHPETVGTAFSTSSSNAPMSQEAPCGRDTPRWSVSDLLWQTSMMEEYGRLTFPNGRTGAPVVEGDLLITRGITSSWGSEGPARDRFYAFDTGNKT